MPLSLAKITEISTTCDMFYCESYYNIDRDLSVYVGIKNIAEKEGSYAYGEIVKHIGSVNDMTIEVTNKNIIKVSGYIEGATDNLWGFSLLGDTSHLNSTWWNSSWDFKQPINISNTYGNLVNYPVNISFTSANVNYSKMLSNGCDLRFTDNLSNLLNHYIETWNASGISSIWVNVSSLLNNTNTTVYMYYGNALATCNGNASKVFDIYDNFSTNNNNTLWNMTGSVYVNTTSGYLYSYGATTAWNTNTLKTIANLSRKDWYVFYGKYNGTSGGTYFSPRWQLSTTESLAEWNPQATTMTATMYYYYQYYLANVVLTYQLGGGVNNTVWSPDTWAEFKIILRSSGHQWYYRNLSMASWVNPLNTSNCTDTSLKAALTTYGGTVYWDDFRIYQQVPSGISYTFGTEEVSGTFSFIYVCFYDEDTNSPISPANLTFYNSTYSYTYYNTSECTNIALYRNGTYKLNTLPSGDSTLSAYYNGYTRNYYTNIDYATIPDNYTYNVYFPVYGCNYIFYVKDNAGSPITDVLLNVQRYVNGSYRNVVQGKTQIDGGTSIYAKYEVPYTITATKAGFTEQTFSYTFHSALCSNPIYISMVTSNTTGTSIIIPTGFLTGFNVTWNPVTPVVNGTVNVTLTDNLSIMTYQYINVTIFNYTNTYQYYFSNTSDASYHKFTVNVNTTGVFSFITCAYRNSSLYCANKLYVSYVPSTYKGNYTGIGGWNAETSDKLGGMSTTVLQIIILISLAVFVGIMVNMVGAFAVILIPFVMVLCTFVWHIFPISWGIISIIASLILLKVMI
jgi:hypothetical protein